MPGRAGTVRVILSGRLADLPAAALRYPEGRLLAGLAGDRRAGDPPPEDRPAGDLPADPFRDDRPRDRRADERPADLRADERPADPRADGDRAERPADRDAGGAAEDGAPARARSVTA